MCDMRLSRWDLLPDNRAAVLRESVPCTPALSDLVHHAEFIRTDIRIPRGWFAYNPSIANTSSGLFMIVRSSNWEYKRHQYYRVNAEDGVGRSRSYLLELDADLRPATVMLLEDGTDRTGEVASRSNRGYEDLRLFEHRGQLRAIATTLDFSESTNCRMALLDIAGNQLINRRLLSDGTTRSEKNWSPAIWNGELFLVYSFAPTTLLRWEKDRLLRAGLDSNVGPPIASDLRGGSQLVPFSDGFLTVAHTTAEYPDRSRVYLHRFIRLDDEFRITGMSPQFVFRERSVEFAAGFAIQGGSALVSFGVADLESWLVRLPLADVLQLMTTPANPDAEPGLDAINGKWPRSLPGVLLR
jgi:predicted GH43/DUF377 family glycosyl hydrolase